MCREGPGSHHKNCHRPGRCIGLPCVRGARTHRVDSHRRRRRFSAERQYRYPENEGLGHLARRQPDCTQLHASIELGRITATCIEGRHRVFGPTRGGRYSWARYYHPTLGRFLSEDPLGSETGEVNFYVYVGNDPINYVDPLGLDKECTFGERFARSFARTNRALTFDLFQLPFEIPLYGDKAHVNPVRFAAGLAASADFFTKTGIPGPIKWAWGGFRPLPGYVPIATTLGLASAGTVGAGVIVGVGWGIKTVVILGAFEAGVAVGSAYSAAVQPLWDPILGPGSGCR